MSTTTEQRRAQYRAASAKSRQARRDAGLKHFCAWVTDAEKAALAAMLQYLREGKS